MYKSLPDQYCYVNVCFYLPTQIIENKKCLGQAQQCARVKPIIEISNLPIVVIGSSTALHIQFRSKRSHTIRKINDNCLWRYVFFLSLLKLQKSLNTNHTLKTIVLYVCGICTVELSVTLPFQTMSECCLTPNEQLLRVYVAMWTKNIRLNDDYVRFMY